MIIKLLVLYLLGDYMTYLFEIMNVTHTDFLRNFYSYSTDVFLVFLNLGWLSTQGLCLNKTMFVHIQKHYIYGKN